MSKEPPIDDMMAIALQKRNQAQVELDGACAVIANLTLRKVLDRLEEINEMASLLRYGRKFLVTIEYEDGDVDYVVENISTNLTRYGEGWVSSSARRITAKGKPSKKKIILNEFDFEFCKKMVEWKE